MQRDTPDTTPQTAPHSQRKPNPPLAVNMAFATVSIIVTSACMFATDVLVIAGYGQSRHGQVTLLVSIAALGTILTDLGLGSKAGVRLIAQSRSANPLLLNSTVGLILVTLGITAVGVAAAVGLGAGWLAQWVHVPSNFIRQAAVWLLAGAGIRACAMVAIGFERMANLIIITSTAEILRLIWTVLCVSAGVSAEWLYPGWTAAWLLALVLGIAVTIPLLIREDVRPTFHTTPKKIANLIYQSIPYQVTLIATPGLPAITLLLMGILLTREASVGQVSILKVTFSLAMIMRIISQSMATSLFPVVARVKAGNSGQTLTHTFNQLVAVLGVVVTGMYAGFWALGQTALGWIGPDYAQGWHALLVLTVAMGIECYRVQIDQLLMGDRFVWVVVWLELLKLILVSALICLAILFWKNIQADLAVATAIAVGVTVTAILRVYWTKNRIDSLGGKSAIRVIAVLALTTAIGCLPWGRYLILPAWAILVVASGLVDFHVIRIAYHLRASHGS